MLLVPSISVIEGRTIRLTQGDYSREKVYNDTPIDVAKQFEDHGISRIHLIDLDGARKGTSVNYDILHMVSAYTDLKINFTGGLHTDGDVLKAFEYGAESVTAASIAVSNKEQFANWLMSYGREKVALAADSLQGKIRIRGWQKATSKDLFDHISYFYDRGLKYLKTTDISKDGAMEGPSFDLYKKLLTEFPDLSIFASGGVRGMDDIKKLRDLGLYGVIFGKAFYEGTISLDDIDDYQSVEA
ncbi:1-(5-phosphoribosyl)-5-[(5-phosphoribosylamino)methylideneamino] imidazole-4-carboxamide isomerase [Ekhidna lutea]|uniref:1-(5-phosphoribosyl)-5-[(5-phosphoribosylamino)methylideneamino] imidazole-4-carboxamide isomerase n=1 Tax=Ekhidna lutea TaxID=447679 RepID=A0A239ICQ3_EKHLU|nr:1-(5-phosphoribosyl)-5-[(5-phosphoribosylamino)methylideneamino] imidazole-4-carboxamide isomerase [Ekhidna lutea]SNS91556.1 1-(5-phosphoribosyl)-5-[(5-phosphoribosylamino)methylideneamino] imidazole-4-carboxamide isomerase [Ekhidna lutea]